MIIVGAIVGYFVGGGWGSLAGAGIGLGVEIANLIEGLVVRGIVVSWQDYQAWRKSIRRGEKAGETIDEESEP